MKYASLLLGILVFSLATGLHGQEGSSQQRPTLGPESAPNHPTLGGTAPSLVGPMNAKILDPVRLRMVHKVFIDLMDNSLNLKLIQDFSVTGPFKVVSDRRAADAVLQGSCFNSPHLKDVHSELYLTGQNGKPIWQDIIHQSYNPPTLRTAVAESATKAVADLRASLEAVERR
jgi:hypothetical protein